MDTDLHVNGVNDEVLDTQGLAMQVGLFQHRMWHL
jgi:hypothetical protein